MASSPLLPLTLHALDHLDQAALKRQAEDLIAQVHPEAPPVQIQAAVEASWEVLPVQLPQLDVPTGSFSFGWRRPATPDAAHRKQVAWAERRRRWMKKGWFEWGATGLMLGITMFAMGIPMLFFPSGDEVTTMGHAFLGVILGGLAFITSMGLFSYLIDESKRYEVCDQEIDFAPYLQTPGTQAYLKAVLGSAVPDLLWGDIWQLRRRLERATRPARKVAQKQARKVAKIKTRQAKVAARQAKIQAKADQRITRERAHQAELAKTYRVAQANRLRLLAQMGPASPEGDSP